MKQVRQTSRDMLCRITRGLRRSRLLRRAHAVAWMFVAAALVYAWVDMRIGYDWRVATSPADLAPFLAITPHEVSAILPPSAIKYECAWQRYNGYGLIRFSIDSTSFEAWSKQQGYKFEACHWQLPKRVPRDGTLVTENWSEEQYLRVQFPEDANTIFNVAYRPMTQLSVSYNPQTGEGVSEVFATGRSLRPKPKPFLDDPEAQWQWIRKNVGSPPVWWTGVRRPLRVAVTV